MPKTAIEVVTSAKTALESVAPQDAANELKAGNSALLDMREPEEWQHGYIDGSIPAPRGLLEFFADPTSPAIGRDLSRNGGSSWSAHQVLVHRSRA